MRPTRTLAPTAAPVGVVDLFLSLIGSLTPSRSEARLERELAAYLGVEHVAFVSSGKAALTVALQAMHALRKARRVVIPAYTCFSVPAAVIRAGLEPVLVDVNPATLDFDEVPLKRALASRDVLCVVPTHLFGVPADVDRVRAAARAGDVFILEDAAQGLGLAARDGRLLGSAGDVGIFSLGRGKHLTCGEGGIIATNSLAISRQCREIRARLPRAGFARSARVWVELALMAAFIDPRLYWLPAGMPFLALGETVYDPDFAMTQLPATSVGALRRWRQRLERENALRESTSEGWVRDLGLRSVTADSRALLRFPVILSSKDGRVGLMERARERGLGLSTMYPSPLHRIPALRQRFRGQRFPGAEALAAQIVTLPTHRYVHSIDRAALRTIWAEAGLQQSQWDRDYALASC